MSGFITIYNTNGEPVDRSLIYSLTQTLKFRGPDQQNVWVDGNIGMGHALFKTTFEAEYENQPATIDNKIWITCSARIDDRENLVNKMGLKRSLDLSKTPDCELILHAYRKWGEECLDHLLGDFAFVIYDKEKQKLFCARDRFGMRQLYYAQKKHTLIVCNSLGCIRKHPQINNQYNEKAIGGFLLFGDYKWIDESWTMFKDIETLLPAHKLIIENGTRKVQRYWDIAHDISIVSYRKQEDYIEHFLEVFSSAVKDRIRTSSIAISMSGGMDSSSIAAVIKKLENDKKIPKTRVEAVTLSYESILLSSERRYASMVANYLNIPIHFISGDDYPFFYPSIKTTTPIELAQPTLLLDTERMYRKYGRAVMVGITGDALFRYPSTPLALKESGSYNIITGIAKVTKLYGKMPPLGTGFLAKLRKFILNKTDHFEPWFPYPTYINKEFEEKMNLKREWDKMWQMIDNQRTFSSRYAMFRESKSLDTGDWNSDDIFMESDFTLSEKRDPFLDLRLINLILSFPALPWLYNKHILRASMQGLLPNEVRFRPKTPLGYLYHALATKDENKWINKWKPSSYSHEYLKDQILFSTEDDLYQHYMMSRPITLNSWLKENQPI